MSISEPGQATLPSGIALDALDPTIRPQDDLFRHVNGRWLAAHTIPADRAVDGAFRELADQAEVHVREIVEACSNRTQDTAKTGDDFGPISTAIGALYDSFMDEENLESLRYKPLEADLAAIAATANHDELLTWLGRTQRAGGPALAAVYIDTDRVEPDRYVAFLSQAGIGLPDEAYYREEQHAEVLKEYEHFISRVLEHAQITDDPLDAAGRIVSLEKEIAAGHWDAVKDRDAQATYNRMSLTELVENSAGLDWGMWAAAVGIPSAAHEMLIVREPDYFASVAQVWQNRDLSDWKLWATFHLLRKFAPYLHSAAVEENFAFYGTTLTGAQELRDRWKRGVSLVEGALGEAIGQIYVTRHFPADHKARMVELVNNLTEAYRQSISSLEWMGEDTRRKALDKLKNFTPKIGYPDVWRDYSGLELTDNDLVGNVKRSNEFDHAYEFAKIGSPINRDEWFMTPQTVNAYYNPGMNEIVFPAAILQPPFFNAAADDAVNYGGIGAVIGHEIGHGFDDQGSRYDGQGRLIDWWTSQDREEFERRTSALIEQYDRYVPAQLGEDGLHVNGALTIGENIGDLGGLAIALRAYEISLGAPLDQAPVIDGLTGVQRVFLSWAQVWQSKIRDEALVQRMSVDPHSPNEFRCNGIVRNIDAFYQAFDVTESDALYLAPEQRVTIW